MGSSGGASRRSISVTPLTRRRLSSPCPVGGDCRLDERKWANPDPSSVLKIRRLGYWGPPVDCGSMMSGKTRAIFAVTRRSRDSKRLSAVPCQSMSTLVVLRQRRDGTDPSGESKASSLGDMQTTASPARLATRGVPVPSSHRHPGFDADPIGYGRDRPKPGWLGLLDLLGGPIRD